MHSFVFSVSLRFFSLNIDPDIICQQLQCVPKWKYKMGDLRKTPDGRALGGVYDRSYCSFKLAGRQSVEFHEFLEETIADLFKYKSTFDWVADSGGRSELFIGWDSPGNTGGVFESALLRKLGELNIDLALDVYGS